MNYLENLKINIYGDSHSESIGVLLDGIAKDTYIDILYIQAFLNRRRATNNSWSTKRIEADQVEFIQGVVDNLATGGMIEARIYNTNVRSGDYSSLQSCPRPSHADYPAKIKFGMNYDVRGGGAFSGRMTAPMCIAGAIAKYELAKKGINVGAYISEIGDIKGISYEDRDISFEEIELVQSKSLTILSNSDKIEQLMKTVSRDCNSIGGKIECRVYGLPVGLGGAMFEGVESRIAANIYGIPAVKALEFGIGTLFAKVLGSEANDCYYYDDGQIKTLTNNNGGLLGGMTTGMPVSLRVTIKPTPSIAKEQATIDLITKENTTLTIKGRHDVCIVPRAVAVVEAITALSIYDIILGDKQ